MSAQTTRCGFVAVIGEPNAGKSTLINDMVGAKVSIVSPKVQTTRTKVLGIAIQESTQIILVDTPGIFRPKDKSMMERAMVSAAWDGAGNADKVMLVVDSTRKPDKIPAEITDSIKALKSPLILVLNKVDKVRPEALLKLSQSYNKVFTCEATFMVSALKGKGVQDIVKYLAKQMPEGPFHYPEDQISDMPMRLLAAEITREKLFLKLHDELPYGLTVETEEWEEFANGDVKLHQTIYVARDNHKGIILGKGGQMIKKIGEQARQDLEEMLETSVHLKLFVKVRENWMNDAEHYRLWGLEKK